MSFKRLLAILLLVVFWQVLSSTNLAEGNGAYQAFGLSGSRAGNLGYAFIGLADDPSAIYWNPAGLAQIEKKMLLGSMGNVTQYRNVDSDSVSNKNPLSIDLRQGDHFFSIYPDEPSEFRENEVPPTYNTMADFAGHIKWKDTHIGFGAYIPLGSSMTWRDTMYTPSGARMDGNWSQFFFQMITNASVARKINDRLMVGAGMNFLVGRMNFDAHKAFLDFTGPGSASRNYGYDIEESAWGWGVEGVFGIMLKILPNLSLGGVYRTGSNLRWDGKATAKHSLLGVSEGSYFTWRLLHAPSAGIGLAYRPLPKLLISLDWQYTDWTKADLDFNFSRNNRTLLIDTGVDLDWHRTMDLRGGMEYQLNSKMAFQLGFGATRTPVPRGGSGITSFSVVGNVPFVTAGFSLKGQKGFSYYAHMEHHWEPDKSWDAIHRCLALYLGVKYEF